MQIVKIKQLLMKLFCSSNCFCSNTFNPSGFATDFLGFLLIFPLTRKLIFGNLSNKFKTETKNNYIDGEYEDIEDNDDRKFKILAKFIKDMSSETPDIETFLFVKDNIAKYQLNIDITSKALKNKLIEINTTLKFGIKNLMKKSYYEMIYATIIKADDDVKEKD